MNEKWAIQQVAPPYHYLAGANVLHMVPDPAKAHLFICKKDAKTFAEYWFPRALLRIVQLD